MIKIHHSVTNLIGKTPMLALKTGLDVAGIYCKLECFNPTGSSDDRVANSIVEYAIAEGRLSKNGTMVEGTTGSFGLSLAMVGAAKEVQTVLVLPATVAEWWIQGIKRFGAIVETINGDFEVARIRASRLAMTLYRGAFQPLSFESDVALLSHLTTANEIWRDMEGDFEVVVLPIFLGNSMKGIVNFFKTKRQSITIVAVCIEEESSNFLIEDNSFDQTLTVPKKQAQQVADDFTRQNGVKSGVLSGAVLYAAKNYASNMSRDEKVIAILCDSYLE
ncbi:MAG: pyridoxal-phosphate dependent enzyme [Clostridiales bacterium]|jgi:cysteine synthase A|nr:pyridoxal-phosphate dependent enzyme [Clostridiales bacterium]